MTVYKMVDIVGTSGTSVTDAVRAAVERAGETLEDLAWFEVKEIRGRLAQGKVDEFQVKVELGFLLHAADKHTGDAKKRPKTQAASRGARSVAAQAAAKSGERKRSDLAKGFERQPTRSRTKRTSKR